MCNGNFGWTRSFFLAALIVSGGGCDTGEPSQMDPARGRTWTLTRDGVVLGDATGPRKVVINLPGWIWAGEPYGCQPDLAFGPGGEAVITSDVLPILWRIDPGTLAVSVHAPALDADFDKDVGFLRHSRHFRSFKQPSRWLARFTRECERKSLVTTFYPCRHAKPNT